MLRIVMFLHTAGQGYRVSSLSRRLGASNTYKQLQNLYASSKAWRKRFSKSPAAACSSKRTGGSSLCAAADKDDELYLYAQLMLATSPQAYSSINTSQVGLVGLVAPAGHQLACESCVAFAVTAAAETAMAAALGVPVDDCSISVQGLFFCPPVGPTGSCQAGWTLPEALEQLAKHSSSIPTADCLPYRPNIKGDMSGRALCEGYCNATNKHARQGNFRFEQITDVWRAQQHIRQHGAVVTRFDVYPGEGLLAQLFQRYT